MNDAIGMKQLVCFQAGKIRPCLLTEKELGKMADGLFDWQIGIGAILLLR